MDYGLHYSDDTRPFLATWYSLAAATVTALSTIIISRFCIGDGVSARPRSGAESGGSHQVASISLSCVLVSKSPAS